MFILGIIGLVLGIGSTVAGAVMQKEAQEKQLDAAKNAAAQQHKAEKKQAQKQMNAMLAKATVNQIDIERNKRDKVETKPTRASDKAFDLADRADRTSRPLGTPVAV